MADKAYIVEEDGANQETGAWAGQEVGSELLLDLNPDVERAVVAAGWLTPKAKEKK